uniref:Uncharacterized protein n=1 Tax=Daphnia galeata TaxID=27404 RepID=A0A8J2RWX0_9CRUS|nr:unnamed protein product [Daphnia galeata]
MARDKGTMEGICKTTAIEHHQPECYDGSTRNSNSSSDESDDITRPFENDPLTGSVKKPVAVPSTMFEYIGPVPGREMSHFKCLLGCSPAFNTNGTPKYISCSNLSRFNIRRHVKLKHKAKLNQFDNESKNLNNAGELSTSKNRSKSPLLQLKQNKKRKVSGKTVSCQTEFCDQQSNNDISINPVKNNHSSKNIGFKKPVTVPSTMFQYIGPVKGAEMSLFKCLLGCLPAYNSNGTQKYISCANNSRFNLRRHVKLKHKSKLLQFNERSRMLGSLKEELDKQSESTLFQLKRILDQQENASDNRSNEDLPRKKSMVTIPHSIIEDLESSASPVGTSLAEHASDNNLSVTDGSSLPFVDVTDFLQMTLDVQPSLAKEGDIHSCTNQHETRSATQSDSASENQPISSNLVRRMYSSSKEKSSGAMASKENNDVPRLSRQSLVSTPEDQNTLHFCPEDRQTNSSSSIDIDYMHLPCAITVNQALQDDADEPDSLLETTVFRRSPRSSQSITKQIAAITVKELSKTVEGKSLKEGAEIGASLKPSLPELHLKELKLSPYKSSEFQDKFGNHVYWLQLIRRPKLLGNTVVWTDVYQEIQPNTVPNRCEIKFQTSLQGTIITKYYKPIKLSQNANDVIDNYPFAAWTSLITVSTETIHVLKLTRITGINDPMLHLIPELILS